MARSIVGYVPQLALVAGDFTCKVMVLAIVEGWPACTAAVGWAGVSMCPVLLLSTAVHRAFVMEIQISCSSAANTCFEISQWTHLK
jgi:hypothetical protein